MKIIWLVALVVTCFLILPALSMPHDEAHPHLEPRPHENTQFPHPATPKYLDHAQIKPALAGVGFALGPNDESHLIRMLIEGAKTPPPPLIRTLLKENKSLEEIKSEISKVNESFSYRGYMRLGDKFYRLIDINLTFEDTNTTLEANIVELQQKMKPCNGEKIVANITVQTTYREDAWISEGELVVDEGQYSGQYSVLLDTQMPQNPIFVGHKPPNLFSSTVATYPTTPEGASKRHGSSAWMEKVKSWWNG